MRQFTRYSRTAPTFGFGVSERFFSYLVDKPIRECVVFPLMKPGITNEKKSKKHKEETNG